VPPNPIRVRIIEQGIDWPAWISAGAAVATLAIVAFTAIFALMSLQDARRTRHGQLITDLMRDWTDPLVMEAHRLHARYGEKDILALVDKVFGPGHEATTDELRDWTQLSLIANLIESLGVLSSERAITPEVVYKMWGGAILSAWPRWNQPVKRLREYDNEPDTFQYFERISLEIRRIRNERVARR
jgi:hypothetical protein